mmetsp:Transcript_76001/g.178303  ORF Transcript_76001/g.178303 Transcript_76001/m.178303 type:complete len:324 (-) Transcript_76001:87-1058(-)
MWRGNICGFGGEPSNPESFTPAVATSVNQPHGVAPANVMLPVQPPQAKQGAVAPTLPPPMNGPLPTLHGQTVTLMGTNLSVKHLYTDPFMTIVENLVTPDECRYLRDISRPALADSRVVNTGTSGARSSTSCRLPRTDPVVHTVLSRCLHLLGLHMDHLEPVQCVHYNPGQEYQAHFDFFDEKDCDYQEHMSRGGNRMFTVFVYLNTVPPHLGGSTGFQNLGTAVNAVEGRAVFWANEDRRGVMDERMLHSGDPILEGTEKFGLNIWIRKGPWVQPGDPVERRVQPTFLLEEDKAQPGGASRFDQRDRIPLPVGYTAQGPAFQ